MRRLLAVIAEQEADESAALHIVICAHAEASRPTFFGPFPNAAAALRVAAVVAATLREENPESAATFTVAPLLSPALMELPSSDHERS